MRSISAPGQDHQVEQTDEEAEQGAEEVDVLELLFHDREQQSFQLEQIQGIDLAGDDLADVQGLDQIGDLTDQDLADLFQEEIVDTAPHLGGQQLVEAADGAVQQAVFPAIRSATGPGPA